VVEVLGDNKAVLCVDERGFPKKGRKSVGVKRQYSGILGRVNNCQIGVFINCVSQGEHVLVDRRLYLPEEWADDWDRREEAQVPEKVVFRAHAVSSGGRSALDDRAGLPSGQRRMWPG
jgi:SRSO17 transposase